MLSLSAWAFFLQNPNLRSTIRLPPSPPPHSHLSARAHKSRVYLEASSMYFIALFVKHTAEELELEQGFKSAKNGNDADNNVN